LYLHQHNFWAFIPFQFCIICIFLHKTSMLLRPPSTWIIDNKVEQSSILCSHQNLVSNLHGCQSTFFKEIVLLCEVANIKPSYPQGCKEIPVLLKSWCMLEWHALYNHSTAVKKCLNQTLFCYWEREELYSLLKIDLPSE
jgi:hypothetical protein